MKFTVERESLLRPLQLTTGVVERRQTLPVLSNLLIEATGDSISITGTDLEVEVVVTASGIKVEREGTATVPARKLADIWRSLPEQASVSIATDENKTIVRSGKSRFTLASLPSEDFPRVEAQSGDVSVVCQHNDFRRLLEKTSFAMAQQDVRYFLNGLMLEITGDHMRTVATDGHRLAMCTVGGGVDGIEKIQSIVPRKGVLELQRLVSEGTDDITLSMGRNHLRVTRGSYTLTTKLVDGKFPPYESVIPKVTGQVMIGDRDTLKQAFHRAAILSNEKFRCVRLMLKNEQLTVEANNPDQEEAEEIVPVEYQGEDLEIGFNVGYLQDVLNVLDTEVVKLSVADANSSALIEGDNSEDTTYVVMPMRL